jgi:uncharacterized protein YaiL (DUF2058 family)
MTSEPNKRLTIIMIHKKYGKNKIKQLATQQMLKNKSKQSANKKKQQMRNMMKKNRLNWPNMDLKTILAKKRVTLKLSLIILLQDLLSF